MSVSAFVFALCVSAVQGQGRADSPRAIPSLAEPGEELTVRRTAARTNAVTFASSPGRGLLLPVSAAATAETRAKSFVDLYGKAFGLSGSSQVRLVRASAIDSVGIEHVRLQQLHRGVPVTGGEVIVHLKGARVMAANGHTIADPPADVTPAIDASRAQLQARRIIEKHRPSDATGAAYSEPRLEIFSRTMLSDPGVHRTSLAWFVKATSPAMREFIWIDAKTGAVLLHFNQLPDARSREIYTAAHTASLPGTLVRVEGGAATGDADQDNAYTFAGITYDYYLTNHGRDSYDNAGAPLLSTCHFCPIGSCPSFQNAFWNGEQMVYGDGFSSADDVVGHELTHAVTEYTADLFYYVQSGALNESFSDIFGETIDLTDGVGTDTPGVRWLAGEDLSVGPVRNMMTPNDFGDPGKMSDANYFVCSERAYVDNSDHGGVHSNSGIPNHAYALMVDGGTYNSRTITGIGLTKAAKIQYRALSTYLTSGSGFIDDYDALIQSCTDLIGTASITAGDCTQVTNALLAVEMNSTWACPGAAAAPAKCPSGVPSYTRFDGFETGLGGWTATNDWGAWLWATGVVKTGDSMAWGTDDDDVSDHNLALTTAITIPAGGRLYFDHLFEFENFGGNDYDGGVLEYSTNGGSVWTSAGSLMDAGQTYNGTVNSCCLNPLGGQQGFVRSSYGYSGTRLNLAALAGQNVKFRFRIGTDFSDGSLGWLVDNVAIYNCVASTFTDDPLVPFSTVVKKIHVLELRNRIDALRIGNGLTAFSWADPLLTGSVLVQAAHIMEMRTALAAAYAVAHRVEPSYTDPVLTIGTTVKSQHVAELRAAVLGLE